jgi:predicted Fe-S protein YdhL (DUF1289 family)
LENVLFESIETENTQVSKGTVWLDEIFEWLFIYDFQNLGVFRKCEQLEDKPGKLVTVLLFKFPS